MGAYDASLGAMLIGTWANAMLYMLEFFQIITVLNKYEDSAAMKGTLVLLFIFDTVCTGAGFAVVYLYNITYWGNIDALAIQYWPMALFCIAGACTTVIVQGYLIRRFWILSGSIPLTCIMCTLSLCTLAGGFYVGVITALFPKFADRGKAVPAALLWFVGSSACDISIAAGLVWKLRNTEHWLPRVLRFHRRLIRASIQTGVITSFFALTVLVIFLQNHQSTIAVAVNFCLGRIYALTMLNNLQMRDPAEIARVRAVNAPQSEDGEMGVEGTRIRFERGRSERGKSGESSSPKLEAGQIPPTESIDESIHQEAKQWQPHTMANDELDAAT